MNSELHTGAAIAIDCQVMKKRWFIIICVVCLLLVAVLTIHISNDRRKIEANEQKGIATAQELIEAKYSHSAPVHINPWRSLFEQFLSECLGLKFPAGSSRRACAGVVYTFDYSIAGQDDSPEFMRDELAKPIEPGVQEGVVKYADETFIELNNPDTETQRNPSE